MTTYISLLRGINVGGQKIIHMEALRKSYESMGFHGVRTYLQSGNVVFEGKEMNPDELELKISRQIEKHFGFEVPVIVSTLHQFKQVVDNNPFLTQPDKNNAFLHVTFLSSKPDHIDHPTIEEKKQAGEEIIFADDVVYLYCPNGYGRTKLTNTFLEAKLKVGATTRNWKTTNELFNLAQPQIL